jgi:predicted RNase H-like HicB family nuclease
VYASYTTIIHRFYCISNVSIIQSAVNEGDTKRVSFSGSSSTAIRFDSCNVVFTYSFFDKGAIITDMAVQYAFRVHIEELENGQYLATSQEMPGLVAQGRTIEEAVEIAHDVARRLIESYEEHGDPLPAGLRRTGSNVDLDITSSLNPAHPP